MDEIEELTMLLVLADPDDSNQTPFGSVKYVKLTWIQLALGSTNSRSAGMNPKDKGKIKHSYVHNCTILECRVCSSSLLINR